MVGVRCTRAGVARSIGDAGVGERDDIGRRRGAGIGGQRSGPRDAAVGRAHGRQRAVGDGEIGVIKTGDGFREGEGDQACHAVSQGTRRNHDGGGRSLRIDDDRLVSAERARGPGRRQSQRHSIRAAVCNRATVEGECRRADVIEISRRVPGLDSIGKGEGARPTAARVSRGAVDAPGFKGQGGTTGDGDGVAESDLDADRATQAVACIRRARGDPRDRRDSDKRESGASGERL